ALDAPRPETVSQVRSLVELASFVFTPHKPAPSWLDAARLPEIRVAVDKLEPATSLVKMRIAAVGKLFNLAILEADVEALQLRFDQIHYGLGKLRPGYWRDKRFLRERSKSGRVRLEEIKGLREAVECKRKQLELAVLEKRWAGQIGA